MVTQEVSENIKLANKISKLIKGQIIPDQYPLDEENIMALMTAIYSRAAGETMMFPSVYEAAKQILSKIEPDERDEIIRQLRALVAEMEARDEEANQLLREIRYKLNGTPIEEE